MLETAAEELTAEGVFDDDRERSEPLNGTKRKREDERGEGLEGKARSFGNVVAHTSVK